MTKIRNTTTAMLLALVFTVLFHKQSLGLNLIIAETMMLFWLFYTKQFSYKTQYTITLLLSFIATGFATIITHSTFAYIMHFFVLFLFVGVLTYPTARSLTSSLLQAFNNLGSAVQMFYEQVSQSKFKGKKIGTVLRRISIFIIPIVIIYIFILIYRNSNPVFDDVMTNIFNRINTPFEYIFSDFDFLAILTFLLCLYITVFIFFRRPSKFLIQVDQEAKENLERRRNRNRKSKRYSALKNEVRTGVFLLFTLNILLLILNITDIKFVWFGFEWEGQFLKQFVHEGTYLLILSILISIGLVLYYFRGNLNFYSKNRTLKILSYFWIAQNTLLVVSVAIRNMWYISYFSLAYKRIGVFIFLLLTLYGLYSVYIKVRQRKTSFYLFKTNSLAFLIVLTISSLINWDGMIARYNFNHYNSSFVHLDFLSELSDKTLPLLDKTKEELNDIHKEQAQQFSFEQEYMSPEAYYQKIADRKKDFIKTWEQKNILEWNYAEYTAYKRLKNDN